MIEFWQSEKVRDLSKLALGAVFFSAFSALFYLAILAVPQALAVTQSVTLSGCTDNYPAIRVEPHKESPSNVYCVEGGSWFITGGTCALWDEYPYNPSPWCTGSKVGNQAILVDSNSTLNRATLSWNIKGEAKIYVVSDAYYLARQTFNVIAAFYNFNGYFDPHRSGERGDARAHVYDSTGGGQKSASCSIDAISFGN